MSTSIYGIKETKEVITAMKDAAVITHNSIVRKPDGSIDAVASGQQFAINIMMDPESQADFKAAMDNIGEVKNELKDLQWGEAAELAAHCTAEIKAASDKLK